MSVLVSKVAHHRQQDGDGSGVVDNSRERTDEPDRCAELLVFAFARERGDCLFETLNRTRPTDAFAQNHHHENRDRCRVREAGDTLTRRNARPRTEYHQRDHDPDRCDVDRDGLGDEQNGSDENNQKDEERPNSRFRHRYMLIS
jgi:hypothetical protein